MVREESQEVQRRRMEQWNRRYPESSHRFDPEPKIKKKGDGRFYLASAQLEGRLGRAAR